MLLLLVIAWHVSIRQSPGRTFHTPTKLEQVLRQNQHVGHVLSRNLVPFFSETQDYIRVSSSWIFDAIGRKLD